MKKWVNRTWAKAAAFALTLVFAALTALGALGIAVLVSQGVFLDGGDALSAALYDEQCHSAISQADTFLRGVLTDAGLLNESSDAADQPDGGTYFEGYYLDDAVIPNLFAQHFPRESFPCRLAVIDTNSGEVVFDNFSVNSGETILRSLEETFVYGLTTDATLYLTISAHLLEPMAPSSYAALMAAWLLEHTGLAVFLTALFGLLALFCFCFSMASAGHWQNHEGIHLTWLDKIPADLWAAVLVCAFSAGWDAFYMEWGRIWFCVAMIPFVLLFLCVFAAQCKAGTIIRSTVIARVLRLLWRVLRGLGVWLWHIGRGLPLVWKTALVGLVIAGGEFLLYVNDFYLVRYNIFLALKIVELLALLAVALNLRTLEKNGQRLAEGDLTTPVDTRRLFGAFRRYGQAMNRLQSGMENAVQEQMRAERMKTELITNVSHDIKTPLTSIVNYVDLLKKEDIPSPIAREYIAVLDRQSKRLKKLTEDLVQGVLRRAAGGSAAHRRERAVQPDRGRVSGSAGGLPSDAGGPAAGGAARGGRRQQAAQPRHGQSGVQYLQVRHAGNAGLCVRHRGGRPDDTELQERIPGGAEHLPRRADGALCARGRLPPHGGQRAGTVHRPESGAADGRHVPPVHRRRPVPGGRDAAAGAAELTPRARQIS